MCYVINIANAIPFNGHSGPVFQPTCIFSPLRDLVKALVKALITPAIGLPVIDGDQVSWIAYSAANNNPWDVLVGSGGTTAFVVPNDPGFYWTMVVPLSLAILTLATAFTAIRAGTLSKVEAQKQFRRLGIGFLTCFFWLPIASLALRFFNKLAFFIALGGLPNDAVADMFDQVLTGGLLATGGTLVAGGVVGSVGSFIIIPIILVAVLFTLAILAMRWILVIIITLAMPLVAAFWAVDTWPMNHFSDMASSVTGVYTGLLVSGLPSAFLFRVMVEITDPSSSGGADFGLGGVVVTMVALFLPVYVVKTTTAVTSWAAGMAAMSTAQAGQQPVQRAARYMAIQDAVEEGNEDAFNTDDYQRAMNEYYKRGP